MPYGGGRKEDDIVNWVTKKAGPASVELTCDQLKLRVTESKFAIAHFGDFSNQANSRVFIETSGNPSVGDKFAFFHV